MKIRRHKLHRPEDAGEGVSTGTASSVVEAPAAAPVAPAAPASMLEAIERGLNPTPAAEVVADPAPPIVGQPRDELGRFTFKNADGEAVDANGVKAPDQAAALAAQAAAPQGKTASQLEAEADPAKMPEGLGPKAQERFQTLANTNRELNLKVERFEAEIMPAVQAMQETWQANQVQPEQFEQAMTIIGLMNRGDYAGALAALQPQLQLLSAHAGQTLQIDPLAAHPDLQAQVQQLMMTPEAAAEVARARTQMGAQQQTQQRQQQARQAQEQEQQQTQQAQQLVTTARTEVDAFCKQMQGADLDYSAIEAQLLPVIPELLKDVPPQRWASLVKQQYQLIKNAVGSVRRSAPGPAQQPLRSTGQGGGVPQPANMFDAMWNRSTA